MSMRVRWDDSKIMAVIEASTEDALRDCAAFILDESRKQVPFDTGALSRSGNSDADGSLAVISYDTPYAVRWHEEDANFQRGRKKKYLEDPLNDPANQRRMIEYLRRGMSF